MFIFSCAANRSKGTIVIGVDPTYPPYSYLGGEYENEVMGFDMEIMKEVALDTNKKIVIKIMSLNRIIAAIESGDIDVALPALTINDERMELVEFSDSSFHDEMVALVRKDDMTFDGIATKEELGVMKIMGTPAGTFAQPITHRIADDENIVQFDTFDEAIQGLLAAEVDAVLIDRVSANAFISRYGEDNLTILSIEFDTEYYGFALKKGNVELLSDINRILERLIVSGEYTSLVEEYIVGYKAD